VHELTITTQIVENVLFEAKKQNATQITEVHLIIGKLAFLGIEQIRFSYNILIENTIMKNSKLIIEEKDGFIKCSSCGYKGEISIEDDPIYHVPIPILCCPKCENVAKIVEGKECTIKRIRMVKED
jgi:hydrogenase nickel incorporation protein HypA/HybF